MGTFRWFPYPPNGFWGTKLYYFIITDPKRGKTPALATLRLREGKFTRKVTYKMGDRRSFDEKFIGFLISTNINKNLSITTALR